MPTIRDIIQGKCPLKRRNKKALLCIDFANFRRYLNERNIQIDWKEFKDLILQIYTEVECRYYDGTANAKFYKHANESLTDDDVKGIKDARDSYFNDLRNIGYIVKTKPLSNHYQKGGILKFKCNFDVEITIDALDNIKNYDVLILCSGDGDFVALAKYLKLKLKEVHVIAPEGRANQKLIEAATDYDEIGKLLFWDKNIIKK
jgi:uncharacterized LabA/DUF88 family protein